MLHLLRRKHAHRSDQLEPIEASYLDIPFGEGAYDFVVSVMSLHHLLPERKLQLYTKIRRALQPDGAYIEGDYVVSEPEYERMLAEYQEKVRLIENYQEGMYHMDIPLTIAAQRSLLLAAGFAEVEVIWAKGLAAVYVGRYQVRNTQL